MFYLQSSSAVLFFFFTYFYKGKMFFLNVKSCIGIFSAEMFV